MEPAQALKRIAYLLEASRAETYKVRAFRKAADAVDQLGAAEVGSLAKTNKLTNIEGVGATTARVIEQAVSDQTPDYLAHLESEFSLPDLDSAGQRVRDQLQGDCHSHSTWSDGGSPIKEMAEAARDLGHHYLVLTDHSPRLTVAHGLSAERLRAQLDEIAELNEALKPFRILTGIEVDILEDGSLDQSDELLARLDVVVASVHSKLRMESRAMTERMVTAVKSPHTDILGHCTGRIIVGRGRPPSTFDPTAVFKACAETGTAVEINSRPERQDPPDELLQQAIEAGCYISVDTDAHAPGQLEWLRYGCIKAASCGVPIDRIVNGWPAENLLSWAGEHAA